MVSTQVIEARVDIDFPHVFRPLGPLDSIVQAGGRCNRERTLKAERGELKRNEVVIFRTADDCIPPGQYRMAAGLSRTVLDEISSDELVTNSAMAGKAMDPIRAGAGADDCAQRNMLTLVNVEYVFTAEIRLTEKGKADGEK